MNGRRFDKLVRTFATTGSRRGFLAAVGGLAALRTHRTHAANQAPPPCGATGDVCTMLLGCCAGLTCATSAINPSYGVCVPGEGEMTTAGTALVVPFDGDDAAAAQTVTETATSTASSTTDPIADQQAELQARRDEQQLRRSTRKNDQQARKDLQKDRRQENREERDDRNGPNLRLEVVNPGSTDPIEFLRVTNTDEVNIVLNAIYSLPELSGTELASSAVTLQPGETFRFLSRDSEITDTTYGWTSTPICSVGAADDGFLLKAAFSSSGANTDYEVLCDGGPRRRRKRRKNDNQKSRDKGE